MKNLTEIRALLAEGKMTEFADEIEDFLAANPTSDEAWFLLGNYFRKKEDWQNAINAYQRATDLNPESPAAAARENIYKILNFFNKDLFNQ